MENLKAQFQKIVSGLQHEKAGIDEREKSLSEKESRLKAVENKLSAKAAELDLREKKLVAGEQALSTEKSASQILVEVRQRESAMAEERVKFDEEMRQKRAQISAEMQSIQEQLGSLKKRSADVEQMREKLEREKHTYKENILEQLRENVR